MLRGSRAFSGKIHQPFVAHVVPPLAARISWRRLVAIVGIFENKKVHKHLHLWPLGPHIRRLAVRCGTSKGSTIKQYGCFLSVLSFIWLFCEWEKEEWAKALYCIEVTVVGVCDAVYFDRLHQRFGENCCLHFWCKYGSCFEILPHVYKNIRRHTRDDSNFDYRLR